MLGFPRSDWIKKVMFVLSPGFADSLTEKNLVVGLSRVANLRGFGIIFKLNLA